MASMMVCHRAEQSVSGRAAAQPKSPTCSSCLPRARHSDGRRAIVSRFGSRPARHSSIAYRSGSLDPSEANTMTRSHWWPIGITAVLLVTVCANFGLLYVAGHDPVARHRAELLREGDRLGQHHGATRRTTRVSAGASFRISPPSRRTPARIVGDAHRFLRGRDRRRDSQVVGVLHWPRGGRSRVHAASRRRRVSHDACPSHIVDNGSFGSTCAAAASGSRTRRASKRRRARAGNVRCCHDAAAWRTRRQHHREHPLRRDVRGVRVPVRRLGFRADAAHLRACTLRTTSADSCRTCRSVRRRSDRCARRQPGALGGNLSRRGHRCRRLDGRVGDERSLHLPVAFTCDGSRWSGLDPSDGSAPRSSPCAISRRRFARPRRDCSRRCFPVAGCTRSSSRPRGPAALGGAAVMLVFWAGTVPMLLGVGFGFQRLDRSLLTPTSRGERGGRARARRAVDRRSSAADPGRERSSAPRGDSCRPLK